MNWLLYELLIMCLLFVQWPLLHNACRQCTTPMHVADTCRRCMHATDVCIPPLHAYCRYMYAINTCVPAVHAYRRCMHTIGACIPPKYATNKRRRGMPPTYATNAYCKCMPPMLLCRFIISVSWLCLGLYNYVCSMCALSWEKHPIAGAFSSMLLAQTKTLFVSCNQAKTIVRLRLVRRETHVRSCLLILSEHLSRVFLVCVCVLFACVISRTSQACTRSATLGLVLLIHTSGQPLHTTLVFITHIEHSSSRALEERGLRT